MKNRLLVTACILLFMASSGWLWAQQDPQFTQFMFNRQVINPAVVGAAGAPQITLGGRSQWIGIDGQPNTITLSGNMPIDILRGGVGLHLIHDRIGPFASTTLKLAYAFRLPIGRQGMALQIGINPGFFFKNLDGTNWRPETAPSLDPKLRDIQGYVNAAAFDLGAGVFFHKGPRDDRENGDKFYVGISVDHITNPKLKNFSENFAIIPSFNIMGGYRFGNGPMSFVPSALFKFTGPQVQMDLNLNFHIRPMVFGLSYRGLKNPESIIGLIGFHATQRLFIAYSYDYIISGLGAASSGSHELTVTYTFPRIFKYYPYDLDTKRKPTVR